MARLEIELPYDLMKYVEFVPQEQLNEMFADMLRERVTGVPVVQTGSSFDEEEFFTRLEKMLDNRTVVGTEPQHKSKEEIKQTFKAAVVKAAPVTKGGSDDVVSSFLMDIFK